MNRAPYAILLAAWEKIIRALANNVEAGAGALREALARVIAEARNLGQLQGTQQAAKQQTTKDLQAKIQEGRELAERLRATTRGVYGFKSEKLVEFGIKVRRPRSSSTAAEEPQAEPQPVPEPESEAIAAK